MTIKTGDAVWRPMTQHQGLINVKDPVKMVSAEGCYLTDEQGNQHFDALAGLWCVNVGYGRKELAQVASAQMETLSYLAPTMMHAPAVNLANKLLSLLKVSGHVYFTSSGSEANETAFKIARQYHLQTGNPSKYKIISRYRAYHGNTMATMTATGQAERKVGYDPLAVGFLHVPPPYSYRAHPNLSPLEHGEEIARTLEETIIYEGSNTVAAFIMEPIISGGGVLVPPDNYMKLVREICDRHNVLLIFDEVVSGFGRTGAMFGQQHWGIAPDITTLAKGISSGYMPLAATVVQEEIFEAFYGEADTLQHFRQINTYGGHPVATAVGLANIELIEREGLVQNAQEVGGYLAKTLSESLGLHPKVGEIRGKGLLIGVELVTDRASKTPLSTEKSHAVVQACAQQGVLIGRNGNTVPGLCNVLILAPPLIITKKEVDNLVKTLNSALV